VALVTPVGVFGWRRSTAVVWRAALEGDASVARGNAVAHPPASELVVARHDERARKAKMRELRRLAENRRAALVLFPSISDLASGRINTALVPETVGVAALSGATLTTCVMPVALAARRAPSGC
jgi:hypothetical protein